MIRRAETKDEQAYLEMWKDFNCPGTVAETYPEEWGRNNWREAMRPEGQLECYMIETKDGKVGGYALLRRTYSTGSGGVDLWVDELYVRPDCRGQGLGKEFFAYMKEHLPASRYYLEVERENAVARHLYERVGFQVSPYDLMVIKGKA